RRRHTRFSRDWSSDVCSSDLTPTSTASGRLPSSASARRPGDWHRSSKPISASEAGTMTPVVQPFFHAPTGTWNYVVHAGGDAVRSEERRVGKEGGARRGADRR